MNNVCNILRWKEVTRGSLNLQSGTRTVSHVEHVTETCNTPLFSDHDRRLGICRACRSGWEVEGNKFANQSERERALTVETQ